MALPPRDTKEMRLMRMKRTLLLTMALLVVSGVLAGCGGRSTLKIGWRGSDARRRKWANYVSFSGVERASFRAQAGEVIRLDYDVEVEKGSLTIQLLDPDGEAAWEKTFEEGDADEVVVRVSQNGRYRLHIEGNETGGSYDVSWEIAGD